MKEKPLPDFDADGLPRVEVEVTADGMRRETTHELFEVGRGAGQFRRTGRAKCSEEPAVDTEETRIESWIRAAAVDRLGEHMDDLEAFGRGVLSCCEPKGAKPPDKRSPSFTEQFRRVSRENASPTLEETDRATIYGALKNIADARDTRAKLRAAAADGALTSGLAETLATQLLDAAADLHFVRRGLIARDLVQGRRQRAARGQTGRKVPASRVEEAVGRFRDRCAELEAGGVKRFVTKASDEIGSEFGVTGRQVRRWAEER